MQGRQKGPQLDLAQLSLISPKCRRYESIVFYRRSNRLKITAVTIGKPNRWIISRTTCSLIRLAEPRGPAREGGIHSV